MHQQLFVELYRQSNALFEMQDYAACVAMLTDCLTITPGLSTLYCNRAVANFKQAYSHLAHSDLQRSIQLNHLNHVAHFNIFSLAYLQHADISPPQQAFEHLVCALSSAYTLAAQQNTDLSWAERSLYFCYNNKESIVLKALVHVNYDLETAHQLLNQARELQTTTENIEILNNYIQVIEKKLKKNPTAKTLKEHTFQPFKLKTRLSCPRSNSFEKAVKQMVRQYNEICLRIKASKSTPQDLVILNLTEKSSIAEKQTNPSNQPSSFQNEYPSCQPSSVQPQSIQSEQIQQLDNISSLLDSDQSYADEDQVQLDDLCLQKINSYDLYPLDNQQKVLFFIQKAFISKHSAQSPELQDVYVNIHFDQETIRTAVAKCRGDLCRWQEWSQPLPLTAEPSQVSIKIYNKHYTEFKDELIGSGTFTLSHLGFEKVMLRNIQGQEVGQLELIVEKVL